MSEPNIDLGGPSPLFHAEKKDAGGNRYTLDLLPRKEFPGGAEVGLRFGGPAAAGTIGLNDREAVEFLVAFAEQLGMQVI